MTTKKPTQELSERVLSALTAAFLTRDAPKADTAGKLRELCTRLSLTEKELLILLANRDLLSCIRNIQNNLTALSDLFGTVGLEKAPADTVDTEDIEAVRRSLTAGGEEN